VSVTIFTINIYRGQKQAGQNMNGWTPVHGCLLWSPTQPPTNSRKKKTALCRLPAV
jgi:hypothetical protein